MKQLVFLLIAAGALAHTASAQNASRLITGLVKSAESDEIIEGAIIAVKGRNYASGTQPDGIFYIEVLPQDSVLLVSYPGFKVKQVPVTHEKEYAVHLAKDKPVKTRPKPDNSGYARQ